MASYSTDYSPQCNGASSMHLTGDQSYSMNNKYDCGNCAYQDTGASNSELYSDYGTVNNDGSEQYYYPNDGHSYGDSTQAVINTPGEDYTLGYTFHNNKSVPTPSNCISHGYSSFGQFRQYYANHKKNSASQHPKQRVGGTPTLFMGRDPSYPNELNSIMNPFFCGVCEARLNSIKSANIHYESKAHDKHITTWLKKNFTDKGLDPPVVQRFVTETNQDAHGTYNCDLCKLELSSPQHALQHFNGKRHRQAVSKVSPPTGIGYFNVEGNWVQTGKLIDKVTGKETSYILVKTPTGFEPVVLQVLGTSNSPKKQLSQSDPDEPPAKKPYLEEETSADLVQKIKGEEYKCMVNDYTARQKQHVKDPPAVTVAKKKQTLPDSTTSTEYQTLLLQSETSQQSLQSPQEALESLNCKICGISTTSKDQMLMHLKGSRHTKKLKALGESPMVFQGIAATTILQSLDSNDPLDISMYRTPTGSYYCKPCNSAVSDCDRMKKHISSKKHLLALKNKEQVPASSGNQGQ